MDSESEDKIIVGHWYPAGTSRAVEAELVHGDGNRVMVRSADGREPLVEAAVLSHRVVSARIGNIPRRITFADGSIFVTQDNDKIDRWLLDPAKTTGVSWLAWFHSELIPWLEAFRLRLIVIGVAITLLSIGLARFALPIAVEIGVALTPPAAREMIGRSTFNLLDKTALSPSKLSQEKQREITAEFHKIVAFAPGGADAFHLEFRTSKWLGANAFALPDGTIVVTDELISLVGDHPDAIIAVLGHEIGHVVQDHTLRRLYHVAGIAGMIMLMNGDIGAGLEDGFVQGSGLLALLSYSRQQESEADRYSIDLLTKAKRDPAGLVHFFQVVRDELGHKSANDFLSTHPSLTERIQAIEDYIKEVKALRERE